MCIICAKNKGIDMPSSDAITNMWNNDDDGCGIMWVENNRVRIHKGFMTLKDFNDFLDKLGNRLDLKETPIVMHFRITTHGGTKPENCHPFPISDNVNTLKKLQFVTDIGVAHNGIIHSVTPRTGISDTMEYIASQLAYIKKSNQKFYKDKNMTQLIENAIGSKMAFLTASGEIYTIGHFEEENGILYSNTNYKPSYRNYYCGGYYNSSWSYYDDYDYYGKLKGFNEKEADYPIDEYQKWINVMSVNDNGGYVMINGEFQSEFIEWYIDENRNVYKYSDFYFGLVKMDNAQAFSSADIYMTFDLSKSVSMGVVNEYYIYEEEDIFDIVHEYIEIRDEDYNLINISRNVSINDLLDEMAAIGIEIEEVTNNTPEDFAISTTDGVWYFISCYKTELIHSVNEDAVNN